MSDPTLSDLYCTVLIMLKILGLISLPPDLSPRYSHADHSFSGAMDRVRWLAEALVWDLGSNPESTVLGRATSLRLPLHLRVFDTRNGTPVQNKRIREGDLRNSLIKKNMSPLPQKADLELNIDSSKRPDLSEKINAAMDANEVE